jgi:hypothetical protein
MFPETEQVPGVVETKLTGSPELAVALTENGGTARSVSERKAATNVTGDVSKKAGFR